MKSWLGSRSLHSRCTTITVCILAAITPSFTITLTSQGSETASSPKFEARTVKSCAREKQKSASGCRSYCFSPYKYGREPFQHEAFLLRKTTCQEAVSSELGILYFVPLFPDALDWVVKVWVSFNQLTSPPGICCKSVLICRCYVYVRLQQSVLPNSRPRHTGLLAKSGCSSFPALSKLSFFFMRCFFAYPALSFNFLNVASAFVFFMLGL